MNIIMSEEEAQQLKDYVKKTIGKERAVSEWVRKLIAEALEFETKYSISADSFLRAASFEPKYARIVIDRKIRKEDK